MKRYDDSKFCRMCAVQPGRANILGITQTVVVSAHLYHIRYSRIDFSVVKEQLTQANGGK